MQSLNERPQEISYQELTEEELILTYELLVSRDIPIPLDLSLTLDKRGIIIDELVNSI